MEIKLIPVRYIIIVSLLVGLIFASYGLAQLSPTDSPPNETGQGTTTPGTTQLTTPTSSFDDNVTAADSPESEMDLVRGQEEFIAQDGSTLDLEGSLIDSFLRSISLATVVTMILLVMIYMYSFNRGELRQYIQTVFESAGYKVQVSRFQRKWILNSVEVKLLAGVAPNFVLSTSKFPNYLEYGLQEVEGGRVGSTTSLLKLTLKLQLFKLYLQSNSAESP